MSGWIESPRVWRGLALLVLLSVVKVVGLAPGRSAAQAPSNPEPALPAPRPAAPDERPRGGVTEKVEFPQRLELPARPEQKSELEKGPPPGGQAEKLPLPPLEAGDLRFPINLATALRLADARPLIVAAAQAGAWIAEAQLQKAKVLWLPDLNLGADYIRHDGNGPDTLRGVNISPDQAALASGVNTGFGRSQNQNINFFYAGGAFFLMRNSTDMIFEPLQKRQNLNAKKWDIQTAKNDALLLTARAYFNVHRYRGQYTGAIDVVRRGRKLVDAIEHLRRDLVPAVEVDRARNFLSDLEQQALIYRQKWRRASADLTQVLRLDPRAVVEPLEHDHMQLTLIEPSRSLDELMPIALTNRPELASHQAQVQAALVRIREEKMRPLLPVIQFNGFQTPYEQIQVGVFGIGNGGKMNLWSGRFDFSPQVLWQMDAMGLGNLAMIKWRRGEASKETVMLFKEQDGVAADVTRAQARMQSAAARVVQSERELRAAIINYDGVYEGLGQTRRVAGNVLIQVFRPQEAVFSLQLLRLAYDDYYMTVAQYNTAQFELFHALGYPARELSFFRPPGEVAPVDTTRPTYLPPVGTGPPLAKTFSGRVSEWKEPRGMERFIRLEFVLAVLLLPWLGSSPGRAQPAPLPAGAPAPAAAEPTLPAPTPTAPSGQQPVDNSSRPEYKSPLEKVPMPADGEVVKLDLPPLAPGDRRFPINLAVALRLADARPIIVSAAGATVWVAEAKLQGAKVLWVPSLNFAADYIRHDGGGPDLNRGVDVPQGENALGQNSPGSLGKPLNQNVNFFYSGTGFTYSPNTPNYFVQPEPDRPLLPSPQMQFMTDMIFEPLAKRQLFNASRWSLQASKNDALFMTARAYFAVHKFRGQYAGAIDAVQRGRRLVEEIAELTSDLVSRVEVDRARNLLADLEQQAVSAREHWRIASADLTQILRLDPRSVVEPMEHDHMQMTLIEPSRSLDELIPIGLTNRPELAAHQSMVQAMLVAIRREKLRPLLPAVLINGFQTPYELIEVGGYGVGNGGKMNNWSGRDDISPQAIWAFEEMGFGWLADVKEQRGMTSKAMVELFKAQDGVAADVTRAQADVQSAGGRVVQAERELKAAIINYNGNYEGLRQTKRPAGNILFQVFRPQEVVFALQLLKTAYDNYFASVAEYNVAQFELFHALGYPAREISFFRPPGAGTPVDTSRPGFLPPVGTGPPPATR